MYGGRRRCLQGFGGGNWGKEEVPTGLSWRDLRERGGVYRALVEGSEGKKLRIWKTLRRRNGIINMDLKTGGRAWTRLI
jgi:hypothetical protein